MHGAPRHPGRRCGDRACWSRLTSSPSRNRRRGWRRRFRRLKYIMVLCDGLRLTGAPMRHVAVSTVVRGEAVRGVALPAHKDSRAWRSGCFVGRLVQGEAIIVDGSGSRTSRRFVKQSLQNHNASVAPQGREARSQTMHKGCFPIVSRGPVMLHRMNRYLQVSAIFPLRNPSAPLTTDLPLVREWVITGAGPWRTAMNDLRGFGVGLVGLCLWSLVAGAAAQPTYQMGRTFLPITLNEGQSGVAGLRCRSRRQTGGTRNRSGTCRSWASRTIRDAQAPTMAGLKTRTAVIAYVANSPGKALNTLTGKLEDNGTLLSRRDLVAHPRCALDTIPAPGGGGATHLAVCGGNTLPHAEKHH